LFYSLKTNIPGLEAIEVVEGLNAVRRRASVRTTTSRMRRFFTRRNSILTGVATLLVVFGLLFASTPSAQGYSISNTWEGITSTGGGGYRAANCPTGSIIYSIGGHGITPASVITEPMAYCTGLNASATGWTGWTATLGGSGWGNSPNYLMGVYDCPSVLVGLVVHKDANGYVSGWSKICGLLPAGTSRTTDGYVFGWGNASRPSPNQPETVQCPTGMVAVGMVGATGSILDKIGLRCGTITGATQTTVTVTSTTGTFGSTVSLAASGGNGAGAVTYAVTSAGTAGCSVSGSNLSATAAGTCTVTATKAADTNYAAASSSATTVTFSKANQTITFTNPGTKERSATPFTVAPTASSGQTVSIASSTTSVCTTSGFNITMVTTGTCTIVASQSGNTNYNAATDVTNSFTIQDTTAPTLSSSSFTSSAGADNTYIAGDTIQATFNFTEAVNVTGTPTVTFLVGATNRTASYVSGTGTTALVFSYTVASGDNDTDGVSATASTLSAGGGTIRDAASNNASLTFSGIAASLSHKVDTTAPTVTITRSGSGTILSGQTPTLTFTLSEAATDFVFGDVTFSGGTLSSFGGSGTSYTVVFTPAANTQSGTGSISVASGAFTDAAGNTSSASSTTSLTYDTQLPTVTAFSSSTANGSYAVGSSVAISATTSEAVQSGNTITVTLDTGATVTLTAASAGTSLTGTYTVSSGQSSSDLTVSSFTIGTVLDTAGNAMTSTTVPSGSNNIAGSSAIVIDGVLPTVTAFSSSTADGTYAIGATVNISATTSEAIRSGNTITVTLNTGATVTLTAASAGTSLTGTYTVSSGQSSSDLTVSSFTIGSVLDTAGNAMTSTTVPSGSSNIGGAKAIVIDGVVPTMTVSASPTSVSSGGTSTITFTASEATTTFALADVSATLGTLSNFQSASSTSYSATFTASPSVGGTAVVTVASGSFTDAASNASTAAFPVNITVTNTTSSTGGRVAALSGSTNYVIERFTTVGSSTWTVPSGVTSIEYLIVGGGGAGGTAYLNASAGGGGGGQVVSGTRSVTANENYTISVGNGGALSSASPYPGGDGGRSSITTSGGSTVAAGLGGGGGSSFKVGPEGYASTTGYTGGGGGAWAANTSSGSTGTGGASFKGGDAYGHGTEGFAQAAGGGGGAGGAGSAAVYYNGGAGGVGVASSITGSEVKYGGGGGGGKRMTGGGSAGSGRDGGGSGGYNTTGAAGTSGRGGGGGGGGGDSAVGGTGGTGIVVVRYALPSVSTPVLDTADDSGTSSTDKITSVTTLTFTGSAPVGSTVQLQVDGVNSGSACTANSTTGVWSCDTGVLTDGDKVITAVSTTVLNDSTATSTSSGLTVTVDTTAPTVLMSASSSTLKSGQNSTLTFTLSEPSTNFVTGDATATGGTLASISATSSTVYTAVFTPTANTQSGTGAISIAIGVFSDAAGNTNAASSTSSITYDTQVPSVSSITASRSTLKSWDTSVFTITLSEASTDFVVGDVTFSGGTLSSFTAVSGTSYTVVFTPTANTQSGTGSVSVASGVFTDAAGNSNTASSATTVTYDTLAPTVTITASATTLKSGETSTLTITLSEASTDFAVGDITFFGGTLSSFSGSGTSYSVVFTPTADRSSGSGYALVLSSFFSDAAGNFNSGSTTTNFTYDTRVPTVSIAASATTLKSGETSTLTFTLSEASTSFVVTDITASGGTLSSFSGSGASYTVVFTPTANTQTGSGSVSVASGAFTDAAGNGNTASSTTAFTYDTQAPTVSIAAGSVSLKSGETSTLTITLSEASTDFAVGDITFSGGTLSSFSGSGTSYSVVFTPTANTQTGSGSVSVASGGFTDAAGNSNTASSATAITYDTQAPTVSIAAGSASLKSGETSTLTFTLSEASTNFVVTDITASGGTLSSFAGSGTSYSVVFTPTANTQSGSGSVSVASGGFTDAAGNSNTASSATTITYDTQSPSVSSIVAGTSTLKSGETTTLTITLSEASSNFATGDVSVSGGTLSSVTATSSTVYSVVFTPTVNTQSGSGSVSVASGAFTDAAGNSNTASSATTITYDTQAPTVSIAASSASLKSGETSTLTFTLSEASTDFVVADVSVSGGTLSSFTAVSGTSYTVVFTPTVNTQGGTGSVSVSSGAFTDAAGNGNTASSTTTITYDTQAPTFSMAASSTLLKSGETSTLTFTLSEASSNFDVSDISASGGTLSSFAGSGTSYTVVFTPYADFVSMSWISVATGRFTDAAGNSSTTSRTIVIEYDTQAPTVSYVTSSSTNGTYSIGDTVSIQVVFGETVTVSGTPRLTLETGSTDRAVDYASGSGTSSLTFTYTVQAGDTSTDLDYVSTSSLALNGGSIVDYVGNAATLTLPTPGASLSLGGRKAIVITSAPTKVVSARTPVGTASGAAFTTQPQVSLQDLGNNVVTSDSSTVVTASVSSGATLVGTTTATASSGVATFNNLGITGTAGTAYTITYSATFGGNALTVATQLVTPTVGAATQISITTQPVGATAGALLTNQPVVKVLDSGNNVVTGSSASISVSASGGTLGGTSPITASSGVATFTNLTFAGTANTNYTLTFASSGFTSQTSNDFSVGVGAATKLVLTTSAATAKYGQAFTTQPVVQVQDAGSNVVTSSSAIVTASLSSGTVVGTGNATSSSGVATFSGLGITGSPANYTVTYSSGSLSTASQSITVARADQEALSLTSISGTYGAALTLTTSGGSGTGATTYVVVNGTATGCAESGGVLTVTAAGTCIVTATKALDTNYNAVSSSATTVTFAKANQSALLVTSVSGTYGANLTLTTSGGTIAGSVSYSITGTGCYYSAGGPILWKVAAGTCSVTATMAGNGNYWPVSSSATTVTFAKANQSALSVTSTSGTYGSALTLTTSGGSTAGSVTYSVTGASCSITSGALSMSSAGDCSVTATMAGNGNYEPVSSLATTVTFGQAAQSALTVTSTSGTYGSALTLTTSGGTTGGSVTYVATGTGCSISTGALSKSSAGDCSVTATMAGNSDYNAVSSSATTVTFAKAVQSSLTLTSTTGTYGATITLAYSGGTGTGSISYSVSGTGCSISAGVLSKTAAGDCSVTVMKATDTNYEAASSLATTVNFAQASNTVTFASLADRLWSASTFTVSPTATSGDTPTIASTTTNVCTVASLTVTMVSSGTCSLTASEDGNGNYLAATNVVRTFEIARVTPSAATWTDVTVTYSAASQSVSPPAVSFGGSSIDGAWTYVSSDTTVVSLASSTMTFGNFGTATVTGSFTPTDTGKYNSISATMNVSVDKIRPLFTWANVSKTYGDAPFSLTAPTVTNSVAGSWAYSSANTSVATLSSATATVVGAGTSTITATFTPADTTNYVSGGTVAMNFTVAQVTPLFSWSNVSATYGDANAAIVAPTVTNSIAGSWSYASATTSVAAVSGSEFDFGIAGTSSITATFTPTDTTNYVSGGTVAMTVTVTQATPTFTWSNVAKTYGDSAFSLVAPTVAGSIAGSWSYASATTSVVSISGATASVNAAGSALVTATFTPTDTANYVSGGTVAMTVSVATADQSGLTVTSVSGTYGSTVSLAVSGGTTSGSVSYATTGAGCSITSGVLSKLSAGDCSVTATMAGNDNYNAVSSLSTTVTFAKASQSALTVTSTTGTYGVDVSLATSGGTIDSTVTYVVTGTGCSANAGALTKSSAGTCSVTATMAGNGNYNAVSSSATTVTFARVALTVTADAQSKEYGVSDPLFTRTITSGSLVGSDTLSGSLTRESGEDVNTYAINQGTLANSNYDITFVPANLTITQRPITVTATATTKQYGATDPTFDYSVTTGSLVSGGALTGALGRESGANVGSYAMTIGTLANSNYNITFVPANFTITQRPITVTAAAKSKEYGASDPVFTHTVTTGSLVVGDVLTGSLSRVTGENIGTYAILRGTVGNTNYDITYAGALLTVTQRPITVTADAVTKEFGAADPALTYSITTGSLVVGDVLTGSLSRASGETVGTYLIAQDTLTNSNYAITYIPANLSITQRAITVTAAAKSKEYGATDPELTYSVTTGSLVPSHALSGSLNRATGEDAGTYAISQGTLANSNYNITYVGADLSITQRPITVSAASATKQYGASDPIFAHSVTTGSLVVSDALTGSLSRTSGENVGDHQITIGTLTNSNYAITFVPANLTITQRPITVTADDQTKVFGSTDPPLTYIVTTGSLVGSDSLSGALSRATGEDVGTYAINQGTLTNSNYNITYRDGALTITRATQNVLSVTTSQVTYGTSVVLGSSGGSGTGDVAYAVTNAGTAGCSISADTLTATGDVGSTCTITATKAQSTNYNAASSVAKTVTVIDRAITVSATAVSKIYGDADPTLAYTITSGSLVDGDTLSGALGRTSGENVGTYVINQGTLANANYAITFAGSNLTVSERPITLTAANRTKVFGDSDPSLAYSITSGSVVGSDVFSGSISRNSGENIGTYVIGQGTLANANYAITFNNGSFVINGANQSGFTLSAADTLVTYQESTTLSVTGGNGNGAVSFEVTDGTGGCTITGNTVTAVAAGTCVIAATKAQEGNYNEATSNIVTITVARRAQIVTFTKPADRNFSTTAFTLAPSVDSGLTPVLTSQTANVCTVSGLSVTMRDSGTCTLVASSNSTTNYAAATDVTRSFVITAVVPFAPILDSLTASDGAISASFTLGSSGGSALLNHEYSLDNGITWSPWPNGSITSPLNISNLRNGVEYQVKIRAVNVVGAGAESNMLAVTPLAPVIVVAEPVQTTESTTTVVSSTTTVSVVTTVTRNPQGRGSTTTVARRAVTTTVASRNGVLATTTTTVITTTTSGSTTTTSPATSTTSVERLQGNIERATTTTVKTQTSIFQSFTPTVPAANVPDTIPSRLSPTEVASVVSGQSAQVAVTQIDKQQVRAAIGKSTMMVASVGKSGALEPLLANGSVALTRGSTLRVDGMGMLPGSQVAVWLHSTPTKLGSADVKADGSYAEVLSLPSEIELGGHKVHFIGLAPDGSTMEFALGVTVVDDTVLIMNKAGTMSVAQANSLADANVVSVGTLSSDDSAKLMLWFLVILILVAGLIATKPQRIGVVATRVQRFEMATPWLNGFTVPRLLMVLVGILAGFGAANSTLFDASAPSALWIAIIVVLGVLDVVAGSVAGGIFVCSVLASGSVQSISDLRLMAIVVLLGMLPSCISRVVRPSSRVRSVSVAVSVVMHTVVVVALLNLVTPVTGMQFSVTQSIVEIAWMAALGAVGRELLLKLTHTNEEQRATQLPALRLIGGVALSLLVFGSPVTSIWTVTAWVVLMAVVVVGLRIRVGLRAPSSERVFITSIAAGFLLVAISTGAFIPESQTEQITGATSVLPIGDLKVIGELDVLIDGYPRTFVAIKTGEGEVTFINGAVGQSLTIDSLTKDGDRIPLSESNQLQLVRGQSISISANGYAQNEAMNAWLFSDPVLLGNATTNDNGSLKSKFEVPNVPEDGPHTLQIRLVAVDGKTVSFSIPIVLISQVPNGAA